MVRLSGTTALNFSVSYMVKKSVLHCRCQLIGGYIISTSSAYLPFTPVKNPALIPEHILNIKNGKLLQTPGSSNNSVTVHYSSGYVSAYG